MTGWALKFKLSLELKSTSLGQEMIKIPTPRHSVTKLLKLKIKCQELGYLLKAVREKNQPLSIKER